jgi:hypothetical protein
MQHGNHVGASTIQKSRLYQQPAFNTVAAQALRFLGGCFLFGFGRSCLTKRAFCDLSFFCFDVTPSHKKVLFKM